MLLGKNVEPVNPSEIRNEFFSQDSIPQFTKLNINKKLNEINPKKSFPKINIPPKILKHFSEEFATPLLDIINTSIRQGVWPEMWKKEYVTPVPKTFLTKLLKNLRSISGLLSFNKIQQKFISELIISDMKKNKDPSQYGNQHGRSIQHYLVNMIHKILSDTDKKRHNSCACNLCRLERCFSKPVTNTWGQDIP